MKAQCPNCGAVGQMDESKIPAKAYALCHNCRARFLICTDLRLGSDRRSCNDRRLAFDSIEDDFPYFFKGGVERRNWAERRLKIERRAKSPRMNKLSIAGGALISRSL